MIEREKRDRGNYLGPEHGMYAACPLYRLVTFKFVMLVVQNTCVQEHGYKWFCLGVTHAWPDS